MRSVKLKKTLFTNLKDNGIYESVSRASYTFVHSLKEIDKPSYGKLKSQ